MLTSNVTATTSSASSSTSSTSSNATDAAASQDRFLKLFVAQLKNQDPLNPMDNNQMTTQMAQINTVEGIEKLNATMQSMSSQYTSMQMLQGATLLGHEAVVSGNALPIEKGVGKGAFNLDSDASQVTVQVYSPAGDLIDTVNMGPQSAGRTPFNWNASAYSASGTPTFKVTATQGSKSVTATTFSRGSIVAVNPGTNGLALQLANGSSISYSALQGLM